MTDLCQTIRAEIARRELTAYRLAQETGIPRQRIGAFVRGADMRGSNLSALCKCLGLELRRKT